MDTLRDRSRVQLTGSGFYPLDPPGIRKRHFKAFERRCSVTYLDRRSAPSNSDFFTTNKRTQLAAALLPALLLTLNCLAQDQPPTGQPLDSPTTQTQAEIKISTVTIPAGTRIALVLTHPIQSRYIHRGDDIYAQVSSPVDSGNEVVIPPGTFVQGKVDKLERKGGRGELRLASMSITFPDGYVAPISGPITLESDDGYALKDPGKGHIVGAFALPAAGLGLGALIGHSLGHSQSTTFPGLPPNCGVPTPGCMNGGPATVLTDNSGRLKGTAIGSMVGLAVGGIASMALVFNTHNFFLDVGSPVEMALQQPVSLQQNEVADAVRQSEQHPVAEQPVAQRPRPLPPPDMPVDHGTCYTPDTPGIPPSVIPGPPGPDGIPGPPTIMPGTPPTPGTPYPCP